MEINEKMKGFERFDFHFRFAADEVRKISYKNTHKKADNWMRARLPG